MAAIVRATCPGCKTVLRIPEEWAHRAVKCKKCGAVVQGKSRPPQAPGKLASSDTPPNPLPTVAAPAHPAAPPTPPAPAAPSASAGNEPTLTLPSSPLPTAIPAPPAPGSHPAGFPVPQPYPMPVPYPYPAQPGYDYSALPPGYPAPHPYPMPPGYPPPGYGFPGAEAPPYYAPPPAATPFAVDPNDFPESSSRPKRRYRRQTGKTALFVWAGTVLLLVAGLVVGGIYALPKLLKPQQAAVNADNSAQVEPKGSSLKAASVPFPRRMLVMHASRYLYCNSLTAGRGIKTPDHVTEVARRLAYDWRVPQDSGNNQLFLLTDTAPVNARPMLKPIIQETYQQFCATSRAQDRILIYFGGHAIEKGGKAYLVPVEGDLNDPATLIPLEDFWAKLKECPAQQKVVIFDVCRINEDGDTVRPGSEPMTDALEKVLHAAPPGVQVVTTCSAGQNALEYRRTPRDSSADDVAGSLFLSAMRHVADKGKAKGAGTKPEDPLPLDTWLKAAEARMQEVASLTGLPAPKPKAGGTEGATVAFNLEEPFASRFELPTPPRGLAPLEVAKVTRVIDLPPIRANRSIDDEPIETVIPFAESVMKDYMPDMMTEEEMRKEPDKYKIRLAALAALTAIRDHWKSTAEGGKSMSGLRDTFEGQTNDAVKKEIRADQEGPALISLDLKERWMAMEGMLGELDKEPSKFWRVTFLYALAQVKARWAFMEEYNFALAQILTESLPPRDEKKGQTGYQMVSVEKMKSKRDIQEVAESAREMFAQIAKDHPATPWAIQAKRFGVVALGLKWEPYSPGGMLAE